MIVDKRTVSVVRFFFVVSVVRFFFCEIACGCGNCCFCIFSGSFFFMFHERVVIFFQFSNFLTANFLQPSK